MTAALPQPLDHPARSLGGDRRLQARPQSSTPIRRWAIAPRPSTLRPAGTPTTP